MLCPCPTIHYCNWGRTLPPRNAYPVICEMDTIWYQRGDQCFQYYVCVNCLKTCNGY